MNERETNPTAKVFWKFERDGNVRIWIEPPSVEDYPERHENGRSAALIQQSIESVKINCGPGCGLARLRRCSKFSGSPDNLFATVDTVDLNQTETIVRIDANATCNPVPQLQKPEKQNEILDLLTRRRTMPGGILGGVGLA